MLSPIVRLLQSLVGGMRVQTYNTLCQPAVRSSAPPGKQANHISTFVLRFARLTTRYFRKCYIIYFAKAGLLSAVVDKLRARKIIIMFLQNTNIVIRTHAFSFQELEYIINFALT